MYEQLNLKSKQVIEQFRQYIKKNLLDDLSNIFYCSRYDYRLPKDLQPIKIIEIFILDDSLEIKSVLKKNSNCEYLKHELWKKNKKEIVCKWPLALHENGKIKKASSLLEAFIEINEPPLERGEMLETNNILKFVSSKTYFIPIPDKKIFFDEGRFYPCQPSYFIANANS